MGIVVLLAGVVLVLLGVAGLFGTAAVAATRRLRTRARASSLAYAVIGAVCIVIGAVLLRNGV